MQIPVAIIENWLPVPNHNGYEVSDHGRVRSYQPFHGRGPLLNTPHILVQSPVIDKDYLQLTLSNRAGKRRQVRVHILVLETFIGPRPSPKHDACHNDGNGSNNYLYNLRWDTKKSNMADQLKHGTRKLGSDCQLAVLTDDQVSQIKLQVPNWKRGMGKYFAELFSVSENTISRIKNNKYWKHL